MTPNIPYNDVEAPTFTMVPMDYPGLQTAENILPPIPAKI